MPQPWATESGIATRPEFLNGSNVELSVASEMAVLVTGLHTGVTYNFTVVAFNDIGDSRESTS